MTDLYPDAIASELQKYLDQGIEVTMFKDVRNYAIIRVQSKVGKVDNLKQQSKPAPERLIILSWLGDQVDRMELDLQSVLAKKLLQEFQGGLHD
jgi:hypothetical protein